MQVICSAVTHTHTPTIQECKQMLCEGVDSPVCSCTGEGSSTFRSVVATANSSRAGLSPQTALLSHLSARALLAPSQWSERPRVKLLLWLHWNPTLCWWRRYTSQSYLQQILIYELLYLCISHRCLKQLTHGRGLCIEAGFCLWKYTVRCLFSLAAASLNHVACSLFVLLVFQLFQRLQLRTTIE